MMLPANVNRSTMAAQSRGSVKVLVQPLKLSLLAIATELVSGRAIALSVVASARGPESRPDRARLEPIGKQIGKRRPNGSVGPIRMLWADDERMAT